MSAKERVAAFVLNLGSRHGALGCSAAEFVLLVTRREIASFRSLELDQTLAMLDRKRAAPRAMLADRRPVIAKIALVGK